MKRSNQQSLYRLLNNINYFRDEEVEPVVPVPAAKPKKKKGGKAAPRFALLESEEENEKSGSEEEVTPAPAAKPAAKKKKVQNAFALLGDASDDSGDSDVKGEPRILSSFKFH